MAINFIMGRTKQIYTKDEKRAATIRGIMSILKNLNNNLLNPNEKDELYSITKKMQEKLENDSTSLSDRELNKIFYLVNDIKCDIEDTI